MPFPIARFKFSSIDFDAENQMPACHAREEDNLPPSLQWGQVPEGTVSLMLFCHEPEACHVDTHGQFGLVNWLAYNIPADTRSVQSGNSIYTTGKNSHGKDSWCGPCEPQAGEKTSCYFWLLALDYEPSFPAGLSLEKAMELVEGHVLGMVRLVASYPGRELAPASNIKAGNRVAAKVQNKVKPARTMPVTEYPAHYSGALQKSTRRRSASV